MEEELLKETASISLRDHCYDGPSTTSKFTPALDAIKRDR